MKLSLGFSPCPNDTFIFDALVHKKIDTEGLDFEIIMEDVEALNDRAFRVDLDVTKLSYHAFAHLLKDYVLLDSGSALGNNCGPLLIAKKQLTASEVNVATIAIPGKYTTANFLLSLAFPEAQNKEAMLFSRIEDAVLNEDVQAGLIIHENRFTYQEKGLVKVMDLGAYWETETKQPIPLGGIVIRRALPKDIQQKVERVIRRSVEFALANPEQTMDFVKPYAQEMDESVMLQHIELYVNDYTVSLAKEGRVAVDHLFEMAKSKAIIPSVIEPIYV